MHISCRQKDYGVASFFGSARRAHSGGSTLRLARAHALTQGFDVKVKKTTPEQSSSILQSSRGALSQIFMLGPP